VTVDAKGGDVDLEDVPASLRVARDALPDDTRVQGQTGSPNETHLPVPRK
jgi:hypothetical protein